MLKILNLSSPATIHGAYSRLVRKGYLKKHERGIYVLSEKGKKLLEVVNKLDSF